MARTPSWVNYNDLTGPNSPQMVVHVRSSPPTTASFRLVKYYNSPRFLGVRFEKNIAHVQASREARRLWARGPNPFLGWALSPPKMGFRMESFLSPWETDGWGWAPFVSRGSPRGQRPARNSTSRARVCLFCVLKGSSCLPSQCLRFWPTGR